MPADDINVDSLLSDLTKLFQSVPTHSSVKQEPAAQTVPTQAAPAKTQLIDAKDLPKVSGKYQAPIKGAFYNSGNFSPNAPTDARHKVHNGVDLRASGGTSVYPMCPGIVSNVGSDTKGGNIINIQHEGGMRTDYFHMGTVDVHKGDHVDYDTVLGSVGNSGNANITAPHVHFQVLINGQYQDPGNYFSVPKYTDLDQSKEKLWLSTQYQQQAANFNMNHHINQKSSTANKVDEIVKIATMYYLLAKY